METTVIMIFGIIASAAIATAAISALSRHGSDWIQNDACNMTYTVSGIVHGFEQAPAPSDTIVIVKHPAKDETGRYLFKMEKDMIASAYAIGSKIQFCIRGCQPICEGAYAAMLMPETAKIAVR